MANVGQYRHKDVEGPITYVPIRLQCPDGEKNIYLFGDMHVNITSCGKGEIHHSRLIGNTLRYFQDKEQIDFFAEIGFGSEKENTFVKDTPTDAAHIFFTFTQFFQKGCFKQPVDGRCLANFPNSRFHNIDFRQTLQYECKKEFANVSRQLDMGDLFTIPKEVVDIFVKLDRAISEDKKRVANRFLEKLKSSVHIDKDKNGNPRSAKDGQPKTKEEIAADFGKYNSIIEKVGGISTESQFVNYVIESISPTMSARIISTQIEEIKPEFAPHEDSFKTYLEGYPGRLGIIADAIQSILADQTEKRRSILCWVHFLLSIQLIFVNNLVRKVCENPLESYGSILKFFMKPFNGESFDIIYRESMLYEDRIYLFTYGRVPYYQYKFNNMIKKTHPSLHKPLQKMLMETIAKMKDMNQRTNNYIADMSAMLDIFFVIRLFENFAQVPEQPSGPINRMIAYVGAAHVPNIIKLLKMEGVEMYSPGKFYTTKNGTAMIAPFDENLKIDLSNSQCIKIPLQEVQIDGKSALILPEKIVPLGAYDYIEYKGGVNSKDSPKVYPNIKRKLLNTNDELLGEMGDITEDSEIYQKYLTLSRNLQKRINQLLTLTANNRDKHTAVLALLTPSNTKPITEVLLDETAFAFRAKRSARKLKSKSSKKTKKSRKTNKSKKTKKSLKKTKKSRKVKKSSKKA